MATTNNVNEQKANNKKSQQTKDALDQKLEEIRKYNEEHHTHLSYGQYESKLYWITRNKGIPK